MEREISGQRYIREAESIIWKINKFVCMRKIVNWKLGGENTSVGEFQISAELSSTS